jgi:Tfp pilus assembly protein PilN
MTLNLARRPFANLRPLRRLAVGLWALGGVASLAAIWLFAAYLSGSVEKRGELARLEAMADDESQRIITLESELARFDLAAQNREVEYLNERIAERTFAWSGLFDDLAQVLPWDVRVLSLSPLSVAARRAGRAPSSTLGESFALRLVGSARDGEALLTFLERLFAHPSFADPNLEQERREGGEELQFTLTVTYRPYAGPAPPAQAALTAAPPAATPPAPEAVASPGAWTPPPAAGAAAPPTAAIETPPAEAAVSPPPPPPFGQATAPSSRPADPGQAPVAAQLGWAGVDAGTSTEAPPPAAVPLPLAPNMSSAMGIR